MLDRLKKWAQGPKEILHHFDGPVKIILEGGPIEAKLNLLISLVQKQGGDFMTALDGLAAQVHTTEGVAESAKVLIGGLADKIQALADQLAAQGVDPTALQALVDELKVKTDELADKVATTPVP